MNALVEYVALRVLSALLCCESSAAEPKVAPSRTRVTMAMSVGRGSEEDCLTPSTPVFCASCFTWENVCSAIAAFIGGGHLADALFAERSSLDDHRELRRCLTAVGIAVEHFCSLVRKLLLALPIDDHRYVVLPSDDPLLAAGGINVTSSAVLGECGEEGEEVVMTLPAVSIIEPLPWEGWRRTQLRHYVLVQPSVRFADGTSASAAGVLARDNACRRRRDEFFALSETEDSVLRHQRDPGLCVGYLGRVGEGAQHRPLFVLPNTRRVRTLPNRLSSRAVYSKSCRRMGTAVRKTETECLDNDGQHAIATENPPHAPSGATPAPRRVPRWIFLLNPSVFYPKLFNMLCETVVTNEAHECSRADVHAFFAAHGVTHATPLRNFFASACQCFEAHPDGSVHRRPVVAQLSAVPSLPHRDVGNGLPEPSSPPTLGDTQRSSPYLFTSQQPTTAQLDDPSLMHSIRRLLADVKYHSIEALRKASAVELLLLQPPVGREQSSMTAPRGAAEGLDVFRHDDDRVHPEGARDSPESNAADESDIDWLDEVTE